MKRFYLLVLILTLLLFAGCVSSDDADLQKEQIKIAADSSSQAVSPAEEPAESSGEEAAAPGELLEEKPGRQWGSGPVSKEDASQSENKAARAAAGTAEVPAGPTATLWVTRDFAQKEITGREILLHPGDSVMDILKANLQVKTQYGGAFVSDINGLASGYVGPDKKKMDWFYYVNGIMTSVGAQDYHPTSGEIIWWDYHDWGSAPFTPALIGAFPEPFRSGYQGKNPGTTVLVTAGCEQQGERLARSLRDLGVRQVEVKPYSENLLVEDKKITLVVGLWKQLEKDEYWQGLQKQRRKTGLFVELASDYFAALDAQGTVARRYEKNVGAIAAAGTGLGDFTPVWLVTGLDKAGLDNAVNILTENHQKIKQHFGALVVDGKVVAVPVTG
ncbi:hypothetical protein JOC37_000285 [Desulfohalotomaculum tongense]|uniref:DUF4430 domain-containing protein n=1 Tax=Desulforadius tongensis TaxID=1216062 RepID=UPI001957AB46|nr:DUF4430 domain-containing protein [Desulforadius tongensis]MBM7853920.1 hypothetical protein [Desulforadius tongensis]